MITLLTGQPGNGKTSFIINFIRDELKKGDRVIYTCGIPKITLPVVTINRSQVKEWSKRIALAGQFDEDGEQIFKLTEFAEGSLIIVYEAQKSFSLSGSNVPDHIEYLSEHRHHGIDFLFVTQAPWLVHKTVTDLASKHLHIRSAWFGRKIYEWADFQMKPASTSSISLATVKNYKIDTTTFDCYESASIHTKVDRSIPKKAWLLAAVVLLVPCMIYYSYSRVMGRLKPQQQQQQQQQQNIIPIVDTKTIKSENKPTELPQSNNQQIIKTVYKLPEIVNWKDVSACITMGKICKCYDTHAVEIEIPPLLCNDAAIKGWHY